MHSNFVIILAFAFFVFLQPKAFSNAAIDGGQPFDKNNLVHPPKFLPAESPKSNAANEEQEECIHGPKPFHNVQRCQNLGPAFWVKPYCQNGSSEFFPSIDGTQGWFCQFCQCQSTCAQKCSELCFITRNGTVKTIFYECKLLAYAANVCNNQIGVGIFAMIILGAFCGFLLGFLVAKMLFAFFCRRRHSKVVAQENVVAKPSAKKGVVYNF